MYRLASEILRVTHGDPEAVLGFGVALADRNGNAIGSLLAAFGVNFDDDELEQLLARLEQPDARVFACA